MSNWPISLMEHLTYELKKDGKIEKKDYLVVEEPLEIRLVFTSNHTPVTTKVAVTMRTPGNDEELAAGFLFTEGLLKNPAQVSAIQHVKVRNSFADGNVLEVVLEGTQKIDLKRLQRNFYTSSSCGVCGKASIEAVRTSSDYHIAPDKFQITESTLFSLPKKLNEAQALFHETGGLHAAALFDQAGKTCLTREDIGRHNAVDKAIGYAFLRKELPLDQCALLVSGRAGFEIVQKAIMAGIPLLAAVGAPSSLSVQLAEEAGMTLIGFLRNGRCNVYSGRHRIVA